jgi:hypothetical protein
MGSTASSGSISSVSSVGAKIKGSIVGHMEFCLTGHSHAFLFGEELGNGEGRGFSKMWPCDMCHGMRARSMLLFPLNLYLSLPKQDALFNKYDFL